MNFKISDYNSLTTSNLGLFGNQGKKKLFSEVGVVGGMWVCGGGGRQIYGLQQVPRT